MSRMAAVLAAAWGMHQRGGGEIHRQLEGFSSGCEPTAELPPAELAGRIFGAAVLICFAALFSGLTLGLLGLDVNELEIVRAAGTPDDKRYAERIQPVRKCGNQLLCTLVLGNVAVMSLESILLADLAGGVEGFVISTVLLVVFGEIVPQAICSRYALFIGAHAVPIVRVIMFLLYPVAKPLSMVLDYFLGAEMGTYYSRTEFQKLITMHVDKSHLAATEAAIIRGALTFRSKAVKEVMTPIDRVFSVKASDRLDQALLEKIFHAGYSRVPVWDEAGMNIIGLLYAKDLVLVTPEPAHPVISVVHLFKRDTVTVVDDEELLEPLLKTFFATRVPFAVVRSVTVHAHGDPTYSIVGVLTMNDILAEVLGELGESAFVDDNDIARSANEAMRAARAEQESELVRRQTAVASAPEGGASPALQTAEVKTAVASAPEGDTFPALQTAEVKIAVASAPEGDTSPALQTAEVKALAAHLATNADRFRGRFAFADVEALVHRSPVRTFVEGEVLPSDAVSVILLGRVERINILATCEGGCARPDPAAFAGSWDVVVGGDDVVLRAAAPCVRALCIALTDVARMQAPSGGGGGGGSPPFAAVRGRSLLSTPPLGPAFSSVVVDNSTAAPAFDNAPAPALSPSWRGASAAAPLQRGNSGLPLVPRDSHPSDERTRKRASLGANLLASRGAGSVQAIGSLPTVAPAAAFASPARVHKGVPTSQRSLLDVAGSSPTGTPGAFLVIPGAAEAPAHSPGESGKALWP